MQDSIEAKFAQTLNHIATSDDAPPSMKENPLLARLGQHLGRQAVAKVDTELKTVYKQVKALELQAKAVVGRHPPTAEGDSEEDHLVR